MTQTSTMPQPRIDILLAAHNGARFLGEQVQSLLGQSYPHFRILVRDDASADATPGLLAELAARWPEKIETVDSAASVSARGATSHAVGSGGRPLRDVLRPGRRSGCRRRSSGHCGPCGKSSGSAGRTGRRWSTPIWRSLTRPYGRWDGPSGSTSTWNVRRGGTLNRLLVQNVVTGCAAMVNRPLVEKAVPIPPEAVHHDWWFALVAAALGRVEPVDEATVLYRQHGGNQVGALRRDAAHVVRKARDVVDRSILVRNMRDSGRQARAAPGATGPSVPAAKRSVIEAYVRLGECGFLGRRWRVARYGFYRTGWLRNLSLLARI